MRQKSWVPTTVQAAPGMRRVLQVARRLDTELSCWEEREFEAVSVPMKTDGRREQEPLQ